MRHVACIYREPEDETGVIDVVLDYFYLLLPDGCTETLRFKSPYWQPGITPGRWKPAT